MTEPAAPPPPPQEPPQEPPQAPPTAPPPPDGGTSPNTVMIVLSYLGILALIPLLVEKDDKEVQWHAKHGLVQLAAFVLVWIVLMIVAQVPILGWIAGCLGFPLLGLGYLILAIMCIVKGVGGGRLIIPGVSQYADRF